MVTLHFWSSKCLDTWCKEPTHWKRPWCWESLKAGGEGDDRGWDGWMASLTQWTWTWARSRSLWWIGKPGVLQSMGSQRGGHDWVTELSWKGTLVTNGCTVTVSIWLYHPHLINTKPPPLCCCSRHSRKALPPTPRAARLLNAWFISDLEHITAPILVYHDIPPSCPWVISFW